MKILNSLFAKVKIYILTFMVMVLDYLGVVFFLSLALARTIKIRRSKRVRATATNDDSTKIKYLAPSRRE